MRLLESAAAGVVASIAPVMLALAVLFQPTPMLDGVPDNAPHRAAFAILMLSPIGILAAGTYFLALSGVLARFGRLTKRGLLIGSGVAACGVACIFAVQGLGIGGVSDAVASFFLFGSASLACFGAGSLVFWKVHERRAA